MRRKNDEECSKLPNEDDALRVRGLLSKRMTIFIVTPLVFGAPPNATMDSHRAPLPAHLWVCSEIP